jgi:hypothetical protein
MKSRKARRLTKAELRAAGATPGLMLIRYGPDGNKAKLEQLTEEASARREIFSRSLIERSDFTANDEGSE